MASEHASPRAAPQLPNVALLFETTNSYARSLLVGIGEYMLSHGPWAVHYAELGPTDRPPKWLSGWDGQGIIIRGENRRLAAAVKKLPIPVVDLTPSRLLPSAPWVKSDDAAVAWLGAQHFLNRGFHNFAFCGDRRFSWSDRRGAQFGLLVRGSGHSVAYYKAQGNLPDDDGEIDAIGEWLVGLSKPVGVFACYDNRGREVLEACRRRGLAVPEEVAVLGVDNDEVLSVLSPPPLSSVILNPRRVGWEGAALLALMMKGEVIKPTAHMIPPVGVKTRQSSDILAVADRKVAEALRYIREHACEGISVSDLLRRVPMARRSLETRFRKLLGRTPREEILRVQLNRVKQLLTATKLPVWEIADRTGFEPDYLSGVFKRQIGMSPSEYRKRLGSPE